MYAICVKKDGISSQTHATKYFHTASLQTFYESLSHGAVIEVLRHTLANGFDHPIYHLSIIADRNIVSSNLRRTQLQNL